MTEALPITSLAPRLPDDPPARREDITGGFNFADAVRSLETRASQSLETHGAAPANSPIGANGDAKTESRRVPQTQGEQPIKAAAQTTSSPASSPQAQPVSTSQNSSLPQIPLQASANSPVAPASGSPAANPGVGLPLQVQTATARTEATALRAADATRTQQTKAPRPTLQPQKPQAPTEDFAKLLARRLDHGKTQFELRLDPPELGKVEAHLKLADDGDNILALKFEHQSTLDLFARDQAALRTALASSGFEFNDHSQFTFTLAETSEVSFNADDGAISTAQFIDPQFTAHWSSGVIDLSV